MRASIVIWFQLIDEIVLAIRLQDEFVDSLDDLAAGDLIVETVDLSEMVQLNSRQRDQPIVVELRIFGSTDTHLNIINSWKWMIRRGSSVCV